MYSKQCTKCKVLKSYDEFNKSKRESDGLQDQCRVCNKEVAALYRANNKEKEKARHALYDRTHRAERNEYLKKWQRNNKDKVRKYAKNFVENHRESELQRHKIYYKNNAEKKRKNAKEWRENNIEYVRVYDSEYSKNNKDKINAKNARKRAIQSNAWVKWANNQKIRDIYKECARLTKKTGIKHHVDHIIPIKGKTVCGLHWENNLQILTAHENLAKLNKLLF